MSFQQCGKVEYVSSASLHDIPESIPDDCQNLVACGSIGLDCNPNVKVIW